jgi:Na+/H+ antiporter NhaD/arsenite permease-like protein
LTVLSNLIVIERSRRTIRISFLEYLKVGIPLTLLTLWVGILILG